MNIANFTDTSLNAADFSKERESIHHKTQSAFGRCWKFIDSHLISPLSKKCTRLIEHGLSIHDCTSIDIIVAASNALESSVSASTWLIARAQACAKYLSHKEFLPDLSNWSKKSAKKLGDILHSPALQKSLAYSSIFTGILILPGACKYLYDSVNSFIETISGHCIDKHAAITYFLNILDGLTYLAWSPAGILDGLVALGHLSEKALCWIPILNVAFTAVSGALTALSAFNIHQLIQLKKEFEAAIHERTIDQAFELMKDKIKGLSDFQTDTIFLQDKQSLQEWLEKVENHTNPEQTKQKAIEVARKCFMTAIWAETLNGCSSALWCIGGVTLIIPATTSISPVILAAAAISSISACTFGWYSTDHLEKEMAAVVAN